MATRDFHLIDLISQGRAVERLLAGLPRDTKLAWLARHGDEILFVGDHVWFRGPQ